MGPKSKNKGAKTANQVALDKKKEKSDENRWKQINAFSRNDDTPQGYNSDDDSDNDDNGAADGKDRLGSDGFADMMSRILSQKVDKARVPVLAKRKTMIMKELEEDRLALKKSKKARLERLAEGMKQNVVPDVATKDLERQLKRLATRGVVALFNAINSSKRERAADVVEKKDKRGKKAKAAKAAAENAHASSSSLKLVSASDPSAPGDADGDDEGEGDYGNGSGEAAAGREKAGGKAGKADVAKAGKAGEKKAWKALQEDHFNEKDMRIKSWDQVDSDDAESDDEDPAEAAKML